MPADCRGVLGTVSALLGKDEEGGTAAETEWGGSVEASERQKKEGEVRAFSGLNIR